MKSWAVRNGDLVLGTSGHLETVEGEKKLLQDLRLWVMEPLGVGFLTPAFGSTLSDMVGTADAEARALDIESEVERILDLYQANQFEQIKWAYDNGMLMVYTKREILNLIEDVSATVLVDSVTVTARIRNAVDNALNLQIGISDEGLAV